MCNKYFILGAWCMHVHRRKIQYKLKGGSFDEVPAEQFLPGQTVRPLICVVLSQCIIVKQTPLLLHMQPSQSPKDITGGGGRPPNPLVVAAVAVSDASPTLGMIGGAPPEGGDEKISAAEAVDAVPLVCGLTGELTMGVAASSLTAGRSQDVSPVAL